VCFSRSLAICCGRLAGTRPARGFEPTLRPVRRRLGRRRFTFYNETCYTICSKLLAMYPLSVKQCLVLDTELAYRMD
jgi:hypothetical protein